MPPTTEAQTRVEDLPLATGGGPEIDEPSAAPPPPEGEPPPPRERPLSPRDQRMAEIALARARAIERELVAGEKLADAARAGAGLEPLPHPRRETPAGAPEEAHPPASLAPAPPEPPPAAPVVEARPAATHAPAPAPQRQELIPIELDGNRFEVTLDQYKQLAEFGARANVAVARYGQQPQQQPPQQAVVPVQQQPPVRHDPGPVVTPELAQQFAEKMLYGGADKVAAALAEFGNHIAQQMRAQSPQQQQIDPMAIAQFVGNQVWQRQMILNDLNRIEMEFPRIAQSRMLTELAGVQLGHLRQENQVLGRAMSNLDQYREACRRVLAEIGEPRPNGQVANQPAAQAAQMGQPAPAPVVQSRSDLIERKRAVPTQPNGVDRRAGQAQPVERALTPSEIVQSIQRARGQR